MLFALFSVPAYANENIPEWSTSYYSIVIPDSLEIDGNTGIGSIEIVVDYLYKYDVEYLEVIIESENTLPGSNVWKMVDVINSNKKLSYSVGTSAYGNDIRNGDVIIKATEESSYDFYFTMK